MASKRPAAAPSGLSAETVAHGSGNVFADLGLRDPDEMLARAELLRRVTRIVDKRGLSQAETATLLGLKQPDVSALLRGRYLRRFSTDRLMRFLTALGQDVRIVVRPKAAGRAEARISVGD